MARPREFSIDEALEKAMHVFWDKGYESASLRDLTAAMGISKSSLYDTFGSKHELFLAAIDRYNATVSSCSLDAIITQNPSPRAGIQQAFETMLDKIETEGETRGCFVSNCAVEVATHDGAAANRVSEGLSHIEDSFYRAIERGRALGEIHTTLDSRAVARHLTSTVNGLMVMAKANPDRRTLQDVVDVALSVLG